MKTVTGNLISLAQQGEFDVIIHGCNCFNTMGAGIAPQIAKAFPKVYEVDQKTNSGDKNKLGTISFAMHHNLFIVNAYTQYSTGGERPLDYAALHQCFKQIKVLFSGRRIGFPQIGCGLAGGDWNIVSKLIDDALKDEDYTYVEWDEI